MLVAVDKLRTGLERIVRSVAFLGIAMVPILILLMSGNVAMRYAFGMSSIAAQELEWHLLVPIAVIGIAYALQKDYHVRVDFFYSRFPYRARAAIQVVGTVLIVLVALYFAWLTSQYAYSSYSLGEGSTSVAGLDHRWIVKAIVPVGFLLLALQSVASLLDTVVRLARGTPLNENQEIV